MESLSETFLETVSAILNLVAHWQVSQDRYKVLDLVGDSELGDRASLGEGQCGSGK
jgi:hypothetical protein